METRTMPSGAILEMTLADFEVGYNLVKAVSREIENLKLQSGTPDMELIKNVIMRVIYADGINSALKPCFERCKYNKRNVVSSTFEDESARGDYLNVVKEVLVYNLTPFFKNLNSLFTDITSQAQQSLVAK